MNVFIDLQRFAIYKAVRPSGKASGRLTTRIVEYIADNPGQTAWQIRQGVDAGKSQVLEALYRLDRNGAISSRVLPAKPNTTSERTALHVKHYWIEE